MKLERDGSLEGAAALQALKLGVEEIVPAFERSTETPFLARHHVEDEVLLIGEIRVSLAHDVNRRRHEAGSHQIGTAELPGVANSPP